MVIESVDERVVKVLLLKKWEAEIEILKLRTATAVAQLFPVGMELTILRGGQPDRVLVVNGGEGSIVCIRSLDDGQKRQVPFSALLEGEPLFRWERTRGRGDYE